jgi:hypothetical protein
VIYEQLRRHRVQANITASARLSARSRLDEYQSPPAGQRATGANEVINTQLDAM